MVPTVITGWDSRPRWASNVNGAEPGPYFTEATPADITNDVTAALNGPANQPTAKADTILMYAWNESDEGGWLVPTLPPALRFQAVDQALVNFQPATRAVSLVNG